MHRHLVLPVVLAFALAAGMLGPLPGASARPSLATVMQDDAVVLHEPPAQVALALQTMVAAGVSHLRVTAVWAEIEPAEGHPDHARLGALDTAVFLARSIGLRVMIDVGFRAPAWATRGGPVTRPDPRKFAAFAAFIAARYSGHANGYDGALLPRAELITLWNEPNDPGFLGPQRARGRDVSPGIYRRMVELAYPAVKRASPSVTVLVGATSAGSRGEGLGTAGTPPLRFIRELACVDRRLRPLRTPGCRHFTTLPGDGWSHHPYAWSALPGWSSGTADHGDDAPIGDLPRLQRLLDALVARHRLAPGLRDLWITEFGYETDEPVHSRPWSFAQQARLLPRAERIAWQDPHVYSWGQFLLQDVGTFEFALAASLGQPRPPGSWQTGLFLQTGVPKPALYSFRLALAVEPHSVWGHVRPSYGGVPVLIQRRRGTGAWVSVKQVRTAVDGTFQTPIAGGTAGSSWRYVWFSPAGPQPSPPQTG